ncbi:MAG TPA: methane monooxygenase/ammonia monooxygenase subunit A [Candidatus Dormibacteraeota bacterium]|jgi:methane/ammonia monooxygenase subunit A|nr:methane monooxygenase/ammonia monooxygenase subunit A [Candidatus Dormibacteraeota bacterium]
MAIAIPVDRKADELRRLVFKRYRWIDRKWDFMFWFTAAFVVAAAADITRLLFAGDWDFWTDWKDREWWMTITPFATIIIPSALQFIQWRAWRFPTGATYTACCVFVAAWIGRVVQWKFFVNYPMNFVWPATWIPAGILLDFLLLETRSFIVVSVIGAGLWTLAFWVSNYAILAPFLQPVHFMGHTLTVADVQGITYIRAQTPEYLRVIERDSLRTFLQETQYVSLAFGTVLAIFGYWVGQFIGRYLAVWPIGRFLKQI